VSSATDSSQPARASARMPSRVAPSQRQSIDLFEKMDPWPLSASRARGMPHDVQGGVAAEHGQVLAVDFGALVRRQALVQLAQFERMVNVDVLIDLTSRATRR
jgi:hypothetical protein